MVQAEAADEPRVMTLPVKPVMVHVPVTVWVVPAVWVMVRPAALDEVETERLLNDVDPLKVWVLLSAPVKFTVLVLLVKVPVLAQSWLTL